MPRQTRNTYQRPALTHARAMAARQAMAIQAAQTEEAEEPMRRYVFPISQPACPVPNQEEVSAALTQVLEHQAAQEQLLADLLAAVKALTAALLNQTAKG